MEVKIPQHLKHEDGNKRWFDTLAGPLLSGTVVLELNFVLLKWALDTDDCNSFFSVVVDKN